MYQGNELASTPGHKRETILKCILDKYNLNLTGPEYTAGRYTNVDCIL